MVFFSFSFFFFFNNLDCFNRDRRFHYQTLLLEEGDNWSSKKKKQKDREPLHCRRLHRRLVGVPSPTLKAFVIACLQELAHQFLSTWNWSLPTLWFLHFFLDTVRDWKRNSRWFNTNPIVLIKIKGYTPWRQGKIKSGRAAELLFWLRC